MSAGHVSIMMIFRGSALMGIVNIRQILRILSGVVGYGRRGMETKIVQMLAVIHVENEYIMKLLFQSLGNPKNKDLAEKEAIGIFDELFERASKGELLDK